MKILYDYQIFEQQVHGGISRYYFELLKGIQEQTDVQYQLPIHYSSNQYLKSVSKLNKQLKGGSEFYRQFLGGIEFKGKWKLFQLRKKLMTGQMLANKRLSLAALNKQDFSVFHPTEIDDYFISPLKHKPFVITIHDMIDEIYPEYNFHVHSTYRSSLKEKLIRSAAAIIAVSENTKKDIQSRFAIPDEKIKVIYHGVSQLINSEASPLLTSPYLLFVGKRVHYKNFYFFMQCARPFLHANRNLKIACVGAPFNIKEIAFFEDLEIINQVIHFSVNDEGLANLYKHAVAFVYPSLYEGFGMPVLESFQYSCPVIVSHTSSLPEVVGDAGLYIDPKSIESFRQAIKIMLTDDSTRLALIKKGKEQLRKFSWQAAVDKTIELYKSVA